MDGKELVCAHRWREWSFYLEKRVGDVPQEAKWRACARECGAIQRNDEPEPRVVIGRLE